jgi:hypothetical protein
MAKSFRIIGTSVVFLFLGLTLPAYSRQGRQDKPRDNEGQQQQARPARQNQQHTKQQQSQQGHQQEQQKPQRQAKAPQQRQRQRAADSSRRPERTQQARERQRSQPPIRLSARSSGRIPDQRFHSNFGREHAFRMGNPVMVGGYSRFHYGGYWFGFVQPWPVGWYYTDDVYIDYVDGGYYMYDPYFPGTRFAISVVF